MVKLNLEDLKAINEVFKRLNKLRRWSSYVTDPKYNELSKQSLNCIVTYILAAYCEENGKKITGELFPKIALYRAFQKVYIYFDRPEGIMNEICEDAAIDKDIFFDVTRKIIEDATDKEFSDFICEGIGTYEMKIYRVATKIATLVELIEMESNIKDFEEYQEHLQRITEYLENFLDMPGVKEIKNVKGKIFKLLLKISKLRNQTRWSVMCYIVECSVLGHGFDTAHFGYFSDLEKTGDEEKATEMFWQGIWHDVPEMWTGDFPSPVKKMIPNLKAAIDAYADKMMRKKFYPCLPQFISPKIRNLLAKEEEDLEFRKIFKGADYLSADSECWRQYISGSREAYFLKTPLTNFDNELKSGIYELSPTCRELHEYFMDYARKLNLPE